MNQSIVFGDAILLEINRLHTQDHLSYFMPIPSNVPLNYTMSLLKTT